MKNVKQKILLCVVSFLCMLSACFIVYANRGVTASAATGTEKNNCYTLVATGTETQDGTTLAYFNNSSDFTFAFDLLKTVSSGEIGLLNAKKSELDLSADDFGGGDYLLQGKNGVRASAEVSEIRFEAGYRYVFEVSRENGVIRGTRSRYGLLKGAATESVCHFPITKSGANIFGLVVRSDKNASAWALIDNVSIKASTEIVLGFENEQGTLFARSSNEQGYAETYKGARYTVVFMDLSGNVLKKVDAQEYTYSTCKAPTIAGKQQTGWSADTTCITQNMIVTPIYETVSGGGTSSDANSGDSASQGNAGGTDCNSTIGAGALGMLLPVFACGAWILKKGRERR